MITETPIPYPPPSKKILHVHKVILGKMYFKVVLMLSIKLTHNRKDDNIYLF